MVKVTYLGSEHDIRVAADVIKAMNLTRMKEPRARLRIQEAIDECGLKAIVLVNGNSVWSKKKIMRNLQRILKHGTLYNNNQRKPPILTQYFYQFLHQTCGSIAHYDIHGWIHKYPTVIHLKKFFKKNEFGKRVLDDLPKWQTDVIEIVKAIERKLFPWQAFMQTREAKKT